MSFGSKSLPAPTVEELARWQTIKDQRWCAACTVHEPVEIHHLLSPGGLRLGHRYTVGLCAYCHSKVKTRDFRAALPNQRLLDRQDNEIRWQRAEIPARRVEASAARRHRQATFRRPSKPSRKTGACNGMSTRRPSKVLPGRGFA